MTLAAIKQSSHTGGRRAQGGGPIALASVQRQA
jgi:hypothetical protein